MKHRHTTTCIRVSTPGLKKLNSPQIGTQELLFSLKKKFSGQVGGAELSLARSVLVFKVSGTEGVIVDDEFTTIKIV